MLILRFFVGTIQSNMGGNIGVDAILTFDPGLRSFARSQSLNGFQDNLACHSRRAVQYFNVFLAVSTPYIQNKKFVLLHAPIIEYICIICANRFRSLRSVSAAITIHVPACSSPSEFTRDTRDLRLVSAFKHFCIVFRFETVRDQRSS